MNLVVSAQGSVNLSSGLSIWHLLTEEGERRFPQNMGASRGGHIGQDGAQCRQPEMVKSENNLVRLIAALASC